MGRFPVSAQGQLALDVLPFPAAPTGPRFLVAHLPDFALERCGWSAEAPVALVADRQGAVRVVASSSGARAAGVGPGMRAAEARALLPGLVVDPWDEAGEADDRLALVRALEPVADRVQALGADAVVLEVSVCTGWYGDEAAVVRRVRERLAELGHESWIGLADHPRAALALARVRREAIAAPGQGAAALAGLPLPVLDPSPELAHAWATLGLERVGELARLDAASVAGRWGAEGVELHRVARGLPGPAWTVAPVEAPIDRVPVVPDDELDHVEAIVAHAERGLAVLRDRLAARERVLAALEVRLDLARGAPVVVPVHAAHPTRDPALLARLLRDRLARIALGAPVTALWLHAAEVVPDDGGQQHLHTRREGGGRWSELVARLVDVLGDDAAFEPELVPTWRPEAAWRPRRLTTARPGAPSGGHPSRPPGARRAATRRDDDPVEAQEAARWHEARPRPTRLLPTAQPIGVVAEHGRPVALVSRRGRVPLRRVRGPERLSGAWWEPDGGFDRAYWTVAVPDGVAWVHEEGGVWYLDGWFD